MVDCILGCFLLFCFVLFFTGNYEKGEGKEYFLLKMKSLTKLIFLLLGVVMRAFSCPSKNPWTRLLVPTRWHRLLSACSSQLIQIQEKTQEATKENWNTVRTLKTDWSCNPWPYRRPAKCRFFNLPILQQKSAQVGSLLLRWVSHQHTRLVSSTGTVGCMGAPLAVSGQEKHAPHFLGLRLPSPEEKEQAAGRTHRGDPATRRPHLGTVLLHCTVGEARGRAKEGHSTISTRKTICPPDQRVPPPPEALTRRPHQGNSSTPSGSSSTDQWASWQPHINQADQTAPQSLWNVVGLGSTAYEIRTEWICVLNLKKVSAKKDI